MSSAPLPDYYALLGVPSSATSAEVKSAYMRKSLEVHPDRHPNAPAREKERLTKKFQSVADAYYVLSDSERRAEYDMLRTANGSQSFDDGQEEKEQTSSANFFSNFFAKAAAAAASSSSGSAGARPADADPEETTPAGQPQANGVFADVFEELMRPEVHRVVPIWKFIGGASGLGLGFIVFNIPGAIAGAFAGGSLGAIRDAKGKSVGAVFLSLNNNQRAEVLKALAVKVLGSVG
ncbi:unnamed protein product [Jaminaea pallidilutea]